MVEEKLESGCNKKGYECPKEGDDGKTFTLKRFLEIIHDIGAAKEKMLEANPNLERRSTFDHSVEKILKSCMLYKQISTIQTTLHTIVFNEEIKTFYS